MLVCPFAILYNGGHGEMHWCPPEPGQVEVNVIYVVPDVWPDVDIMEGI